MNVVNSDCMHACSLARRVVVVILLSKKFDQKKDSVDDESDGTWKQYAHRRAFVKK
jgi:hypothetical protein